MALILILTMGTAVVVALIATFRWREAQAWRASLVCYRLGLPRDVAPDDVTAWLSHVVAATHAPGLGLTNASPVALEVAATADGIGHVLLVAPDMQGAVLSGLRAALPSIRLEEAPDYLANRPRLGMAAEGRLTSLVRPLAHERSERAAAALLAALQPLQAGETVVVQWVFVGATTPVPAPSKGARDVLRAVVAGEDAATDAEALRAARLKQQEPLLRAVVRVGVAADDRARLYAVFGWVWGTLRGLNAPGVRLVRRWLPERVAASRVVQLALPIVAWPLILNTRELTGLLGLPLRRGGVARSVQRSGAPATAAGVTADARQHRRTQYLSGHDPAEACAVHIGPAAAPVGDWTDRGG